MLKDDLREFFKGDIEDSPDILEKYSRDASVFYITPSLVVFPRNVDDVKDLVRFVSKAKSEGRNISLTPRAAGTDMTGAVLTESIVVEFTRHMHHLKELGDDYAIVEPGMMYKDFEKETLAKGLIMPTYPASRDMCAVGGMVANNAGGERTPKYGKTENFVSEVKMVLYDGNEYAFGKIDEETLNRKMSQDNAEGEIYKKISRLIKDHYDAIKAAKPNVTKNSAGYFLWNVYDPETKTFDLAKLITGSQGTLGIITEIKFKLVKPDPASRLLVIFMKDMDGLGDIAARILKHRPESFESYDDNTFKLAMKFLPEILTRIKASLIKLAIALIPEAWLLFSMGGIPKLVLLAEFSADKIEDAEKRARAAEEEIRKAYPGLKIRVTGSDVETQEFWVIRRESFSLLRKHMRGLRTAPFIDDFAVRAENLPEFLPQLYAILRDYNLIYTVAGHIGDGNFHIIPMMDFTKPGIKEVIVDLSRKVYGLVFKYGGTITGEHNDGLIRSPFLKEQYGREIYGYFEETKKIFDPANIFNPGKKVGSDLDYAMAHLDTPEKQPKRIHVSA